VAKPEVVEVGQQPIERFRELLDGDFDQLTAAAGIARRTFEGRTIWQVNSTKSGGGVAEMLQSYLPTASDAGVDMRWLVLHERAEFFELTKRIHNLLHGFPGDGGLLGKEEIQLYEETTAKSGASLGEIIKAGDIVFLHDPQTAGLIPAVKAVGATVLWRCHIGVDRHNPCVDSAIEFLAPYVEQADVCVFSRQEYAWDCLPDDRTYIMFPAIDPFSPKNQALSEQVVSDILVTIGAEAGAIPPPPEFVRLDGSTGVVERSAEFLQTAPIPKKAPLIAQVSRWDTLKDHGGLLTAFAQFAPGNDAHLALIGPASAGVSDDPEGEGVYADLQEQWTDLDDDVKDRVHIINLPMDDLEENAAMVNALQRRADILVQKSLAEGFGLTVAEGMWKGRPMVASAVGGIKDQIVDGESGILIEDPTNLSAFAEAFESLFSDPEFAGRMGEAAHARVARNFLSLPRLVDYAQLIVDIEARDSD